MLFTCSLYESFLGNLVFVMIFMINIMVALSHPVEEGKGKSSIIFLVLIIHHPHCEIRNINKNLG